MTNLESTTVIITISTIANGARIERQWFQRSIWLSDQLLCFLALALIAIEAFVLTCGDVWYTVYYHASCAVSDYLSLYFVGQCWRWLVCG